MIRRLLLLLIVISSCTSKNGDKNQTATNDSIQKYLNLAGNDTLDLKQRDQYNDKAFSLIDLKKNDTITRYFLSCVSFNYMQTKNWIFLNKVGKIHLKKSKVAKDTLNLARFYRYKAGYLKNIFISDSSFYYYIQAEKFYKKTKDQYGLAIVYNNKSQVQFRLDDYTGADLSAKRAYMYYKNTNEKRIQFDILITIGNINHNLRNYENAINSFKTAMFLIEKYNLRDKSFNLMATCLNNIGNSYREQKKYSKAMKYFNLALEKKNLKKEDPVLYGFLLNNTSYCKLQLKDYSGFPNLLFTSIDLLNNNNEGKKESTLSYVYLSNYYYAIKDSLNAQKYADRALKIAKNFNSPYYYLTALSNAGSVNSKKAPQYIKEYHEKNDSILFIERKARNQYYKIQLETDEIVEQKETAIKQKWIICGIALIIILIVILLLIITRQRAKQRELQMLQSQQKANEEIYDLMLVQKNKEELVRQSEKKRIALELHDGVMNKLASTRLNLNILSHKKDQETIDKCLTYIDGIYQIEQEIRSIAHDLKIEHFSESNSFATLLNDFIVSQNDTTKTHYQLEIDDSIDWDSLSGGIKMNLYRIIQEASHNINKFAQAKKAIISLLQDQNNICLSISDDGKGFDVGFSTEGIGLKNIRSRVETLNGKFVIQSISNKSTSINIAIPII